MRWLAFLLLLLPIGWLQAAELKAVRAVQQSARTEVVFELNGPVRYQVFTMSNPERVVIDFQATRATAPLRFAPPAASSVRALRSGVRGSRDLRVVLDLAHPVHVRSAPLAVTPGAPHRIAVQLMPRPGIGSRPGALAARPAPTVAAQVAARPVAPRPTGTALPRSALPRPTAPQPAPIQTVALKPAPPVAQPARAPQREFIIAIDAGHGGDDVGAIGPSGVYEKDIVLAVARELARQVNQQPGMRAVMTRDGDYFLPLRSRMEKARARKADLFISVHADAFRDRRVQGSSVYVLSQSGASSEAAKWLAESENAVDLVGGVSLDDKDRMLKSVLLDLSQTASIEASIDLGNHVLTALKRLGPVHRKRVEHAGFMVLKSPDIPSILVETAFISNPTEEKKLRSPGYRGQLAEAILRGVRSYFDLSAPSAPNPTRLATQMTDNRSHRVSTGETLSGIASQYDVSISSIKLANNMRSEMVRTGELLRIP